MKRIFFAITLLGALCGTGLLIASSQIECDSLYLSLYSGQSCAIQYVSRRCNVTIDHCYGVLPWTMRIDVYKGTCRQDCVHDMAMFKNVGIWMVSVFGTMALVSGMAIMLRPTTIIVPVLELEHHGVQRGAVQQNRTLPELEGPGIEPAQPAGDCPICMEDTGQGWVRITGCGCMGGSPPMHTRCLSKWSLSSATCPFCRRSF